ncbi:recombinase family protein [Methylobacter psychrophilus]|uniref:recombinase family protein n=1 Tax=Methylobacter psychrophilus TaxID=96941 RepID=UPI0021D4B40C|nr:recombinase family protein [Methylobacter psychrophilus]
MNQKIGYARVSTDDQNLDLQQDALKKAGCAVIYKEKVSGKNTERLELEQCRKALRAGDTLMVWRLDRLGRSLPDLVRIVTELERDGIGFESLTEKIETTNANGKLTFHIFAALAEFERNLIRERTHAGLTAARARGRKGGRKPALDEKQIREVKALMRDPSVNISSVAQRYKVSRTTLYKYAGTS